MIIQMPGGLPSPGVSIRFQPRIPATYLSGVIHKFSDPHRFIHFADYIYAHLSKTKRIPMFRFIPGILILLSLLFNHCESKKTVIRKEPLRAIKPGLWRGTLRIQGHELPFQLSFQYDNGGYRAALINAKEHIDLDEVYIRNDSLVLPMHIFDAVIKAKIVSDTLIRGAWIKPYARDYLVPFEAIHGLKYRFKETGEDAHTDFGGKWAVQFISNSDTSMAIGLFEQTGRYIHGTFLTPYGDYRYLDGIVEGDTMKLSTFDGSHAFLFKAVQPEKGRLSGDFWSGKSWHEKWVGKADPDAALPDPLTLTHLKPGYDKISFRFPDPDGKMVSLEDPGFKDKVVLIQIMGSWCPNCMDEARFLAGWYDRNKDRGVEIIGLSFERKDDFEYASARVRRFKEKLQIHYPVLIAGSTSEESKKKALPMLEKIVSFPTVIYLDRRHQIRRIHTGFSGPGTGSYFERYVEEFNLFMDKLLKEPRERS